MLGVIVPTVGRWDALKQLLVSLDEAAAPGEALHAVLVDQSSEPVPCLPTMSHLNVQRVVDHGRGASRARNLGLAALPEQVTHVAWPNDHTTYSAASLAALAQHLPHCDVVVGRLVEDEVTRYDVAAQVTPLNLDNVWTAIEPVTVTSVRAVRSAGGWNEQLGSGATTPWQSSALADLLLRLRPYTSSVAWEPDFSAGGGGFARGAADQALAAKLRAYGRGYGRVLASWDYPWERRLGSIAKPLLRPRYAIGPDVLSMRARAASALGRAEGIAGHLLPGSAIDLRDRHDVRAH